MLHSNLDNRVKRWRMYIEFVLSVFAIISLIYAVLIWFNPNFDALHLHHNSSSKVYEDARFNGGYCIKKIWITDSSSNKVIPDVKLNLLSGNDNSIYYSDSEGIVTFEILCSLDNAKIRLTKDGYTPYTRNLPDLQFNEMRLVKLLSDGD